MVSLGTMVRSPTAAGRFLVAILIGGAAGCGISGRGTRCGITALAGPTMLLEEFTKPGKTMTEIPADLMPQVIPVRMAAGQAQRGLVGRTDTAWVVGVDGPI